MEIITTEPDDTASDNQKMRFQWYDMISVLLLITIIVFSSTCLSILLKYRHVLNVLRFKFICMIFISTISEFAFRLVYEICYHIPSLEKANFLCWTIEMLTEISSIATYTWILILVAYYYTLTFHKTRDPGKKCRYFAWIFGFIWPMFFPVVIFPCLTLAPDFNDINSCWRGHISLIIEIFNFVMKLVIVISVISGYIICIYCEYTPQFLQLLAGVVTNVKGKTNLVALFYVMAILSYIPIGVGVFYFKVHNTLVVLGYFIKGLFTVLCFCLLDSDVQKVLFPNRKSDKLSDDDADMMNVNLNDNLRRFRSEGTSYPYGFADFSTNVGLLYTKPGKADQDSTKSYFDLPYSKADSLERKVLFTPQISEHINKMEIERV